MKLVSVITPTISSRHFEMLNRCVPSVNNQIYERVEHVVISDGPDSHLDRELFVAGDNVSFLELSRNWHHFTNGRSYGAIPRLVGTYIARGEYIAYIDDDDEMLPNHVSELVNLLESTGSDFVFSRMRRMMSDGRVDEIGDGSIWNGGIGTPMVLHKVECLLTANWGLHGYSEDFELFKAWEKAGLKCAYLPKVTILVHKQV